MRKWLLSFLFPVFFGLFAFGCDSEGKFDPVLLNCFLVREDVGVQATWTCNVTPANHNYEVYVDDVRGGSERSTFTRSLPYFDGDTPYQLYVRMADDPARFSLTTPLLVR